MTKTNIYYITNKQDWNKRELHQQLSKKICNLSKVKIVIHSSVWELFGNSRVDMKELFFTQLLANKNY